MPILQEFLQFPFEHGNREIHSDFEWDFIPRLRTRIEKNCFRILGSTLECQDLTDFLLGS